MAAMLVGLGVQMPWEGVKGTAAAGGGRGTVGAPPGDVVRQPATASCGRASVHRDPAAAPASSWESRSLLPLVRMGRTPSGAACKRGGGGG